MFGSFHDLLGATAHSPAMLYYFDNWLSRANGLNENYARELLELHTLAAWMVGTRSATSWRWRAPSPAGPIHNPHDGLGFMFDPKRHDRGEKHILGHRLPVREVVRAILMSPEFFAVAAYRAKVKTPLELIASTLRAADTPINRRGSVRHYARRDPSAGNATERPCRSAPRVAGVPEAVIIRS